MALSKPVGYKCEFVDQVPEDYFCKQCNHVAREPTIASCCTEVLCKACIEAIIQDKKPCPDPDCRSNNVEILSLHKKYQVKIQALKVCCLMKNRGCEWTGQLQHLDAHLHLTTGDCVYVDVDCPSKCNQTVQKRNVKIHLANECLEREHTCRFCHFTATFREVEQHLEICGLYILDCPNRCGVSFERNELEDHMNMCSLQKVQCSFSHAGCEAEFLRNEQSDHSDQNIQKHLALMAATLRVSHEQQQMLKEQLGKVEQKLQEKESQIKALEKIVGEQQEELQTQNRQQSDKIGELERVIAVLLPLTNQIKSQSDIPPYNITFSDYQKTISSFIYSPPVYTHPGGYRFKLTLWPSGRTGGAGTHVSVRVYSLKGTQDDKLIFPAEFIVTLELLNQHRDQDHYTRDIQCDLTREKIDSYSTIGRDDRFIPQTDLDWNTDKETQYLKNDCLKLRVKRVVVH